MRPGELFVIAAGAALLGTMVVPPTAEAQIRERIRERARTQVEERVERRAEDAVDRTLDTVEDAVVCVATDQECIGNARRDGQEVVLTNEEGEALPRESYPAGSLEAGEGPWLNYDFVPGDRVIFAEDFSGDRVGNFPGRFEFIRGNMEVAEWRGTRWLRANSDARFAIVLPVTLPDRFTLEFDYDGGGRGQHTIHFVEEQRNRPAVAFYYYTGGIRGGDVRSMARLDNRERERVRTVRVMADGPYVKVYMDEARVANVPRAELGRSDRLYFSLLSSNNRPVMVGNFRIAGGARPIHDALSADGRVVARGILFDSGSDRLRPESTPVLREIADMLREHPGLRLRIEGHTDNVGDAGANLALSERRAESVRRYLIERGDVGADRLEAAGMGQSNPADSNDTPEGRQNNRRVELVRL